MANDIFVDNYGMDLVMGVGFDMSSNTSLTFRFLKPDLTTVVEKTGILGTIEVTTTEGVFAANTWASYTFVDGDLDQIGTWTVELVYEAASTKITSVAKTFDVVTDIDGT